MKKFTREELSRYDGKEGRPIYVAFDGKVYDLSESFLWQNGYHQIFHPAGADISGGLPDAPHGPELLDKFPVVGILDSDL